MMNPEMPNIPGMGSMTDTLEFVKKLWGGMGIPGGQGAGATPMPGMGMVGMNIPGMVMPTLSVEEINKRITDLKAVESWLTLNMNMLRGTIQALEVQAATLSALNAMGQSVSATMQAAGMAVPQAPAAATPGDGASQDESELEGAPEPTPQEELDAAALTAPLVNAAAWWNSLQDQFQQAVSTAMTAEPKTAPKRAARKSATKTATKTAAKTAAKTASATPRKRKPKT